ncbi:glycine cleavage system aminomethyltransferase GcvT [Listeria seeligeri]|uniref:glycine cleavage system aminomethyltransferase GcvT n=1 Tax=Listeria seeligeri TaxID=1640 RepID=UPI0016274AA6|nr:glycine cleavage system aminomethyltransferase GcvT [Listeria seeligeri]MBC1423815.1 glycine cleavage system aminomethyltransferase GcvT [Listeria seeligeri]MBC1444618.1 glycine cleavage system aminomethyltransferase GcvT [Listeria seeligeri]MBC1527119.1 glycine cleavage system aminomethyltransferase GcvT [Listeria seeligeri]MBC1540501.1 glycine cleavage system aminomethyltransferase GcvT [Listeria seeligeri]MBC1581495.1 glycine cleavage system aminomethyltransferase GcvT [Listeria seeliger
MTELQKTPIHPIYEKYGAKTIDFGGWDLPVQFSGIKAEHEAVRTDVGLFDVSHMGEILVEGPDSTAYLQYLLSNDIEKIKIGKAQYNIMCYENGGTVDDLVVYKITETKYILVVNAANTEKDYEWMVKNVFGDVTVTNVSSMYGQLALQGPNAEKVLTKLTDIDLSSISFFGFVEDANVAGVKTIISRSGYTGEDGFEIYMQSDDAVKVFEAIMAEGVLPIGLGARDTLRLEAVLALYGQELSQDITPLEAGLNFAVKLKKEADFIGKEALVKQKEAGLTRKLVGIELIERGIPRHDYSVFQNDKKIGIITSGTQSPTLGTNIGLALLETPYTELGQEVEVGIRTKKIKAKVIATPFYKRAK